MATTRDRTTRDRETSRPRSRLVTGFDSLTLDPSPRLRRARDELARSSEAGIAEVWKSVGRALAEAMTSVSRTLGAGR
jgi:hypothetical protein